MENVPPNPQLIEYCPADMEPMVIAADNPHLVPVGDQRFDEEQPQHQESVSVDTDSFCQDTRSDFGQECLPGTPQPPPPPSVSASSPGGLRGVVAESNDMARYERESFLVKMEMGITLI